MTNLLTAGHVATRDRYVDALRVGSLIVVIIGHWLMGVVTARGEISNALVASPALRLATWVLQVMPLFFLVGGVAHAHALASLDRRGIVGPGRYATFVAARASRLLRPTLVLIGVWMAAGLLLRLFEVTEGDDGPLIVTALRLVTQPLWFVGLYLGVAALAPAMLAAHRRFGGWVVVALVAAAVLVDLVRFAADLPLVGVLNFAFVWLALHQLGFCWYDAKDSTSGAPGGPPDVRGAHRLSRSVAVALVAGGTAVLIGCVVLGPYPVSMVGVPGDAISNMGPPTVALLAQGLALVGLAVLLRGPGTRLLAHRRVWTVVMVVGAAAMTAFLWHLTALFIAVVALRRLSIEHPAPATEAWWLTRPVWLLVLAVLAVGLVALFRRFDAPRDTAPRPGGDGLAAAGAALAVFGVLMVSAVGVDVLSMATARFIAVDITPLTAVTVLAAALAVLAVRPRSGTR